MSTSKNTSQFIVHDKETLNELDCSDPLKFQVEFFTFWNLIKSNFILIKFLSIKNRILRLRKFDDKIINILNSEIPTESFLSKGINASNKCTQLKQEVSNWNYLKIRFILVKIFFEIIKDSRLLWFKRRRSQKVHWSR